MENAECKRSKPMKGRVGWMAMAVLFLTAVAHATTLTVTDIKVAQRYPWNGLVDITYTVNCDDPTKDVWVYPVGYDADNDKTVAMMPAHLTGDGVGKAVKSGTHRMTWDMATARGKDYNRAAFSVKMHAFCDAAPYMVIDLSSGSESERYEVSYLAEEPEGGWGEEYLTTKMVFRLILPGASQAYPNGDIMVDSPYYFAIYPITQRQWVLVDGGSSTSTNTKTQVSYDMMRGRVLGSKWPIHQQVDADSIVGKMRVRTGMTVDLPTYAQWYRAAKADVHTSIFDPNGWGIRKLALSPELSLDKNNGDIIICGRDYPTGFDEYRSARRSLKGNHYVYDYTNSNSAPHKESFTSSTFQISYVYTSYKSGGSYRYPTKTEYITARLVVCPVSK